MMMMMMVEMVKMVKMVDSDLWSSEKQKVMFHSLRTNLGAHLKIIIIYLYFGCLCVNKYKKAKQDNLLYYVWNVSKLSLLEIRLAGTMTLVFLILHLFSKGIFPDINSRDT